MPTERDDPETSDQPADQRGEHDPRRGEGRASSRGGSSGAEARGVRWTANHGAGLRRLRLRQGLLRDELADGLGVPETAVAGWERGEVPTQGELELLAALVGVDSAQLLQPALPRATLAQELGGVVSDRDAPLLERFDRQVDFYARQQADPDVAFVHWYLTRGALWGEPESRDRSWLGFVTSSPPSGTAEAARGYAGADRVRAWHGLGVSPLPDPHSAAELLGVNLYRRGWRPATAGDCAPSSSSVGGWPTCC